MYDMISYKLLGSGWSTVVEHRPIEQNSSGRGFNSRWVLGFSSSFLSNVSFKNVPGEGAVFPTGFYLINECLAVQLGAKQA